MANLPKEPDLILTVPGDVPSCVLEMIRAILDHRGELKVFDGRRGLLYIDYAPGNVKLRLDKLSLEPVPEKHS